MVEGFAQPGRLQSRAPGGGCPAALQARCPKRRESRAGQAWEVRGVGRKSDPQCDQSDPGDRQAREQERIRLQRGRCEEDHVLLCFFPSKQSPEWRYLVGSDGDVLTGGSEPLGLVPKLAAKAGEL